MWGYLILTMLYAGTTYSIGLAWSPRYADEATCETARAVFQAGFAPWRRAGDVVVATTRCQVWP